MDSVSSFTQLKKVQGWRSKIQINLVFPSNCQFSIVPVCVQRTGRHYQLSTGLVLCGYSISLLKGSKSWKVQCSKFNVQRWWSHYETLRFQCRNNLIWDCDGHSIPSQWLFLLVLFFCLSVLCLPVRVRTQTGVLCGYSISLSKVEGQKSKILYLQLKNNI